MKIQQIAGLILIAGFALLAIGAAVAPPRAYKGPDVEKRLKVIMVHQARWNLSKLFDGLAVLAPAAGFLLLALDLRNQQSTAPLVVGTGAILLGASLGVIYVYRLAVRPEIYWENHRPAPLAIAFLVLFLVGMVFFGIAYLQGDFPTWSGYLSIGAGFLGLLAYLISQTASPFYITAILYLVNLIIGIAMFRNIDGF